MKKIKFLFCSDVPVSNIHAREQANSNNELKLGRRIQHLKSQVHTHLLYSVKASGRNIVTWTAWVLVLGLQLRGLLSQLQDFSGCSNNSFNPACEKKKNFACFGGCCEREDLGERV